MLANRPVIVAIYSPAPQSGKSTVSDLLGDSGCATGHKIAQPLKDMLYNLLAGYGTSISSSIWECLEGEDKETPLPIFNGKSTRYAMQTLAIWGKENFGDNFWLNIALKETRYLTAQSFDVIIDDLRYKNEYNALKAEGAIMVKVIRPSAQAPEQHFGSEGNLENEDFDITLINDFPDVETFREFASYVLKKRIPEIVDLRDSQKGF